MKRIGEQGAIIVFSAIWMVAFLSFVALAINVFFLGTALLQQRNAAEYVALAAVKMLTDPPGNAQCTAQYTNDLDKVNCIIGKAEYAAGLKMLGATYDKIVDPQELVLTGVSSVGCTNQDSRLATSFQWCGYQVNNASNRGYIILGTYTPASGGVAASFSPASSGQINSATAAFVRLNLKNTPAAPLALPFINLLGGSASIKFSSRAIAYRSHGLILLAEDPALSGG